LYRTHKHGVSSISGFLEDYACTIEAFISLYEATLDQQWLDDAKQLVVYTIEHFFDENSGMFFYTRSDSRLIARKMEINDNVMPSSNSVMAKNLWKLGHFYRNENWLAMSRQQLANVYDGMERYGSGYSNWAQLLVWMTSSYCEVIVIGEQAVERLRELRRDYHVAAVFAGGKTCDLPIADGKSVEHETTIFVCYNGTCLLPTTRIDEALIQLKTVG
jgi:uncharacterized protein YyaL (SSP411 family)